MMQSKRIGNDKEFWKTVKPLFSKKNPMSEKTILIEDGKILSNDAQVAECFDEYFCNITDSFDIDLIFKEVQENFCGANGIESNKQIQRSPIYQGDQ